MRGVSAPIDAALGKVSFSSAAFSSSSLLQQRRRFEWPIPRARPRAFRDAISQCSPLTGGNQYHPPCIVGVFFYDRRLLR
jgi:hypothetical protein